MLTALDFINGEKICLILHLGLLKETPILLYLKNITINGYRWLNAKIKLDLGVIYSDNYAQRCCNFAGIRSISRRCKYTKPRQKYKIYPNLLLADIAVNNPFEVVVSDMTAFWCNNTYYELTLYSMNFYIYIISHILCIVQVLL